jgi:hypothetical protein
VIALEVDGGRPPRWIRKKQVDDAPAVRAAVDQVAKQDKIRFGAGPIGIILLELREQILQEIKPPVDVPYRIGATARGAATRRLANFLRQKELEHLGAPWKMSVLIWFARLTLQLRGGPRVRRLPLAGPGIDHVHCRLSDI